LLSSNPAQANTINSVNQDADAFITSVTITRANQTNSLNSQSLNERTNILTSDYIGDLAIIKQGCDCMGCRQTVLSTFLK